MRSYTGIAVTSSPKKRTLPAVAGKSPVMTLNSVVLPAPLAPMTARRSPAATDSETSSSARSAPKLRETPASSSALPDASGCRGGESGDRGHGCRPYGQSGTSREPILNSAAGMPSVWFTLSILRTTLL